MDVDMDDEPMDVDEYEEYDEAKIVGEVCILTWFFEFS